MGTSVRQSRGHFSSSLPIAVRSTPSSTLLGLGDHAYNPDSDGILLVRIQARSAEDSGILGLVIDRIMDSPEIPNRCLSRYDSALAGRSVLTKAVVRPDSGHERATMLSILDLEGLEARILKSRDQAQSAPALLTRESPPQ